MQAMDHAVGTNGEALPQRAGTSYDLVQPAPLVQQLVRRFVRDDEQRLLAGADDQDRRYEHEGIRPMRERYRNGRGQHREVFQHRRARAPGRAARQLLNELFRQRAAVIVLELLADHLSRPPMSTYFTSKYSSKPYLDPSRPRPDCFTPPNGATPVEMMPALAPTMPVSMRSATRKMRPTSRL